MRFLRPLWLVLALGLLLGSCGTAAAASVAPPGNSAVDQYFESVPAANGNQPPGTPTANGGHSSALSARTRQALLAAGADGRATATLAAAGPAAPAGNASASTTGKGGRSASGPGVLAAPSAVAQLPQTTVTASSGISPVLPIILGAAAVLALVIVLLRRRGRTPPPPAT